MKNILLFLREIPLLVWLAAVAGAYRLFGPERRAARRLRRIAAKKSANKQIVWRIDMRTGAYRRIG